MNRRRRPLAALALIAMVALISACGSTAPAGTARGINTAADAQKAVKFAKCMRSNGVSQFPDPDAAGKITIDAVANGSSLNTSTPAFEQAISACKNPGSATDGIRLVSMSGPFGVGSGKSFTPLARMHWANLRAAACSWRLRLLPMNLHRPDTAMVWYRRECEPIELDDYLAIAAAPLGVDTRGDRADREHSPWRVFEVPGNDRPRSPNGLEIHLILDNYATNYRSRRSGSYDAAA
ncbi:MAG: hypothetical protein ACLP0J_04810 [Solirubrobacteraceae bacterium]